MMWQRPASMIATFVALWFAVAIVTTCGAMLESGVRYHGSVQRYAAAPVLVATTSIQASTGSGDDRDVEGVPLVEHGQLAASLVPKISAAPGVRAVVADTAIPAQISTRGTASAVEIHPWSAARLTPFTLTAGSGPATAGEVVLDQHLAAGIGVRPGQQVRIALPSGVRTFTVYGIAAPTKAGRGTPTVFVDDATAATLSGHPGTVGVIGVFADPGVTADHLATVVRAALPAPPKNLAGAYPQVFAGHDRGSVESPAVDNGRVLAITLPSVFGGMALLIAIFVIAGTVGLSVAQRHRDIALLRAIAATPRQVRRLVVREAAVLAVFAAATGVWPGLLSAKWLRDQFVSRGMVPDSFQAHLSWLPPVVAGATAVLLAVAAAWIAGLRSSRIRPSEALAETAIERRGLGLVRTLLGLIALAGGIVVCVVSVSANGDSAASISVATVFTLVVAVALLSPVLIRVVAATFGQVLRVFGETGRLANANLATSARKLATVLSSVVLAVALGGSLWFLQGSETHVASQQSRAGVLADYIVAPAASGASSAVVAGIRGTDGVTAATGIVHSTMFTGSDLGELSAEGVDTEGLSRTLDLGVIDGSMRDLRGDTVAVDDLTADGLGLRVGDAFTGWYGDGAPARLRVVAIYTRGLGFAQLTLPHDVLIGHTSAQSDDAIFVAGRPGTDAALRTALTELAPGSSVLTSDAYQASLGAELVQNAWTNQVVVVVLLVYVVIAAVNVLFTAALARRREFAVLRLAGTTPRQVARMVRLEQALLLGLSLVLGGAIAAATLIPMVKGITGTATPYIPLSGWVTVIGSVIVLGGAATIVPVRRVLRARPVEAIDIRE
ncbi:FtsX-like permease family protein [Rugosimonospora acidiphila]|uniref:FtsX-like permease family protein n=2 Tax=Rugosimonospora acidiphila TaxID=556531 RepID=A0ABP9RU94_9ACTN